MIFKWIDDKSIIDVILKVAGYTYGPLLGLFAFGILTNRNLNDNKAWIVCLAAPILVLSIDMLNNAEWFVKKLDLTGSFGKMLLDSSAVIFNGFKIGIELLIINGLLTFAGLWMISKKKISN
jgi:hypothetical protein